LSFLLIRHFYCRPLAHGFKRQTTRNLRSLGSDIRLWPSERHSVWWVVRLSRPPFRRPHNGLSVPRTGAVSFLISLSATSVTSVSARRLHANFRAVTSGRPQKPPTMPCFGPAHFHTRQECVGLPIKAECEMDARFIFSALAGVVFAATIFATITTVRYVSHRSDTSASRPSGLGTPAIWHRFSTG
jgi:hypothetical protein